MEVSAQQAEHLDEMVDILQMEKLMAPFLWDSSKRK